MITETTTQNADLDYIKSACEAVLFACGGSVTHERLASAIGTDLAAIPPALTALRDDYVSRAGAIEVVLYADGASLVSKSEYGEVVRNALEQRRNQPLSRAALEVLAVVAYNQPVTRAFIDKVRGVESPSVTSSLAEKGLIEEVGRLDAPGHPILYGTTTVFLRTFGLSSIDELENLPELEEIRREFRKEQEDEQMRLELGDGAVKVDEEDRAQEAAARTIEPPREGVLSASDDNAPQILLGDLEESEEFAESETVENAAKGAEAADSEPLQTPEELFADCEAFTSAAGAVTTGESETN